MYIFLILFFRNTSSSSVPLATHNPIPKQKRIEREREKEKKTPFWSLAESFQSFMIKRITTKKKKKRKKNIESNN